MFLYDVLMEVSLLFEYEYFYGREERVFTDEWLEILVLDVLLLEWLEMIFLLGEILELLHAGLFNKEKSIFWGWFMIFHYFFKHFLYFALFSIPFQISCYSFPDYSNLVDD